MKKPGALLIFLCVVSVTAVFPQAFLNTSKYFSTFPLKPAENLSDNDFVWAAEKENYELFAKLSGKEDLIDSNLEFALLTFYSPEVIKLRPAAANNMLAANNIRISGMKLGAAIYKEMTELAYFTPDDKAAIARYEEALQTVSEKSAITRQQIEQYYSTYVKDLITSLMDEEFNKVSFSLTNNAEKRMYFITLIRNPQNGRYTINYETPSVTPIVKTLAAAARESLINELRKRTAEFSQTDIDYIRAQAASMPAVAFQDSVRMDLINIINAFYLKPGSNTYDALDAKWHELSGQKGAGQAAASSFSRVLSALCDGLAKIGM